MSSQHLLKRLISKVVGFVISNATNRSRFKRGHNEVMSQGARSEERASARSGLFDVSISNESG